jgi:hypothetical protein
VGTEVHKAIELAINGQPIPLLSAEAAKMNPLAHAEWAMETWAGFVLLPEIKLAAALESDQARILESSDDRDYGAVLPGWIPGTADLLAHIPGQKHGTIIDWKTAMHHSGRSRSAGDIKDNLQLQWLGLCACRIYQWDSVTLGLVHIGPNGERFEDFETFQYFDLELTLSEIRGYLAASHQPRPGMHCSQKYCPAIHSCPAMPSGIRTDIVPSHAEGIRDDQHALWLWSVAKAQIQSANSLLGLVEVYANRKQEKVTHEGYELTKNTGKRETIKGHPSQLRDALDGLVDIGTLEVEAKLSKSELEKAIRISAPKGNAAKLMREALERLRANGLISESRFETFEMRKVER